MDGTRLIAIFQRNIDQQFERICLDSENQNEKKREDFSVCNMYLVLISNHLLFR